MMRRKTYEDEEIGSIVVVMLWFRQQKTVIEGLEKVRIM